MKTQATPAGLILDVQIEPRRASGPTEQMTAPRAHTTRYEMQKAIDSP